MGGTKFLRGGPKLFQAYSSQNSGMDSCETKITSNALGNC